MSPYTAVASRPPAAGSPLACGASGGAHQAASFPPASVLPVPGAEGRGRDWPRSPGRDSVPGALTAPPRGQPPRRMTQTNLTGGGEVTRSPCQLPTALLRCHPAQATRHQGGTAQARQLLDARDASTREASGRSSSGFHRQLPAWRARQEQRARRTERGPAPGALRPARRRADGAEGAAPLRAASAFPDPASSAEGAQAPGELSELQVRGYGVEKTRYWHMKQLAIMGTCTPTKQSLKTWQSSL